MNGLTRNIFCSILSYKMYFSTFFSLNWFFWTSFYSPRRSATWCIVMHCLMFINFNGESEGSSLQAHKCYFVILCLARQLICLEY